MSDQSENIADTPVQANSREVRGMFEGPVVTMLVKLSIPMFLSMLVQVFHNALDMWFIGKIDMTDPSYVGGSKMVWPLIFLAMAVANGLAIGMSSLVARAIGEKNRSILNRTAESGLFIAIIASIVLVSVYYIFSSQLIGLLGAKGAFSVHAKEYLMYIIPAGAVVFIMHVFIGILQGEGLMKYIMIGMLLGTVANLVLDPIFIFLFRMGVRGAALATTLAQGISCAYMLFVFLRGIPTVRIEFHLKNVSTKVMGKILSIGVPQTFGMMLMSVGFMVFNRIIIKIDEKAFTAYQMTGTFDQIVLNPVFAIAGAVVTLIGQNAGRGLTDRVRVIWRKSLVLAAGCTLFFAAVLFFAAPLIYKMYTDVDAVSNYAVMQTRIMEFTYIFSAIAVLGRSVFQAFGFSVKAMIIMLFRVLGFGFPMVLLFVYAFNMGIYGVWSGLICGNFLGAALGFFWVESDLKRISRGILKVRTTA